MLPRKMRPMRLSRRSRPFDTDQFIYELKIDGFRALAYIEASRCELISRNGNTFRGFADLAERVIRDKDTIVFLEVNDAERWSR